MVAPNYAEQRRTLAKSIGLGTKRQARAAGARSKAPESGGTRRRSPCLCPPRSCLTRRHAPQHRHRSALRRQGAADHRAAPDDRARSSPKARTTPTSRRCTSAPRRSIRTSRSPPSTAPSACSRKPASSSATIRRRPLALRGGVGSAPRPSDRRRDRQGHRVRRRGSRGAPEADRREARLPARRPSDGAVRRRPRPRPLSRDPSTLALRGLRVAALALLFLRLPRRSTSSPRLLSAARPGRGASSRGARGSPAPASRSTARRPAAHACCIANHVSWLDILVLAGAPAARSSSKDKLGHGFIHWLADQNRHRLRRARADVKGAKDQALAIAAGARAATQPVALFPEGTTGPGDRAAAVPLDPARSRELRRQRRRRPAGGDRLWRRRGATSAGIERDRARPMSSGSSAASGTLPVTRPPARAARRARRPQALAAGGAASDRRRAGGFKFRARCAYRRADMTPTPKTFSIKSFGCQMNVYDGERMAELLGDAGPARRPPTARTPTWSSSTPATSARRRPKRPIPTSAGCAARTARGR